MWKHQSKMLLGVWPRRKRIVRRDDARAGIVWVFTDALPADVRDCEYSEIALFKASIFLNYATLGDPTMTFSARSHEARLKAQTWPYWLLWFFIASAIDVACGVLRGESDHCETAWINYKQREMPNRSAKRGVDRNEAAFFSEGVADRSSV